LSQNAMTRIQATIITKRKNFRLSVFGVPLPIFSKKYPTEPSAISNTI
jgi:hypothetical protein